MEKDLLLLVKAKDEASGVIGSAAETIQSHAKAIGVAFLAAGAAGLKMADDSRVTNSQLKMTAIGMDTTSEELRKLAKDTSNVTFPLAEVTASFDLLRRAGVTSSEEMAIAATAFDTLGDAINLPASQVTDSLIPAFAAFDISLEDTGKHTDSIAYLMRNTTIDLQNFSNATAKLAPEFDQLDISMDETVAVLIALADKGIQGTEATAQLSMAAKQAVKDETTLAEALGISQTELAKYSTEVAGAKGITDEYAAAAATQFSMVDKLKHQFSEITLEVGSYLEPMEGLLVLMTAIGPMMLAMDSAIAKNTWHWIANQKAVLMNSAAKAKHIIVEKAGVGAIAAGSATMLKSIAINIAAAASRIWAWAGSIPFVGIGIAIAGIAAMAASVLALRGKFNSFEKGGVVPGRPGEPQMVMAHGGEEFLGVGQYRRSGTRWVQIPIYLDGRNIATYVVDLVSTEVRMQGAI